MVNFSDADRERAAHPGINYQETPAQKVMHEDMEREPVKLGMTLDDVFGPKSEATPSPYAELSALAPALALEIISQSPDLVLSLKQWHLVQNMIEKGIRRGIQLGL